MFDFFSRLFKREGSSTTAKERLRLVLLSDHLSLSPDTVDALKRELIAVISRYVKVDVSLCDVSFEQQAATVAMHANIPILGMHNERAAVAPPVYAKTESRQSGASMHASAGERPYLDDLHIAPGQSATATISDEAIAGVDEAIDGELNTPDRDAASLRRVQSGASSNANSSS